ncbi:hypothetical protein [Bradyrhizobium sp. dw_411]|uniref:hypothetical protein n=1 Tax=Bradyrhizobium sp. dw_411 TaxID=2720082 RepID=UPI001BCE0302|nr:hypothetical protein [Bradyrhizobium sp. dw_411]
MSLSEQNLSRPRNQIDALPETAQGLVDTAERLATSLNSLTATGQAGAFPDETMRQLMAALVKLYAAKFDEGQRPALLDAGGDVSATAVLVATSALMKASNLEIFELGMWQSWSATR